MTQKGAPRRIYKRLCARSFGATQKKTLKARFFDLSLAEKVESVYFSEEFDDITCEVKAIQATIDTLLSLHKFLIFCPKNDS